MLSFFIYFLDFPLKRKCYKTQNNRKFKLKIGEKSIKIFITLIYFPGEIIRGTVNFRLGKRLPLTF